MLGVWGCRVCSVPCRSEDLVESASRFGLVGVQAWHSQRYLRKSDRYPFVRRITTLKILTSVLMLTQRFLVQPSAVLIHRIYSPCPP